MPAAPDSPAASAPPGRRLALVVATTRYTGDLRALRAPGRDAEDLGAVLGDPALGGFEVTTVLDRASHEVRLAAEDFLADRRPGDLLLVYVSCHGLLDARRRLYFATTDTVKDRLAATGVEAQWLVELMEDCRARQQVLILDCCFSGAFARRAKAGDDGADVDVGARFTGQGRGRVVLTASRATEYSFEGEPVDGAAMPGSVFTAGLVAGIRSGDADLDGDGWVSVDDAYRYAFDHVRVTDAQQTPQRWLYGAEGSILLARAPAAATARLARPAAAAVGSGPPPPPPPQPWRVRVARWRRRRIAIAAVLAAGTVAGGAALVSLSGWPGGGDDGVVTPPYRKTLTATAPWRLVLRDDLGENGEKDVGCVAALYDGTGELLRQTETVHGERSYQQHESGTFRVEVDHTGCVVVAREGNGERALPFTHQSYTGDSDAFPATGPVLVEARDTDDDCDLTLRDARTGAELDLATWRPGGGPVSLDPGAAPAAYLEAPGCDVRVSAG
jgi:hypothetical protein